MSKFCQQQLYQSECVRLNFSHNLMKMRLQEMKVEMDWTISKLKKYVESKYGTDSQQMVLVLQDKNDNNLVTMSEDDRTLSYYNPHDNYNVHVIDLDPNSVLNNWDDLSQVEKYVISEQDYDKLPNNFRKFKEQFLKANPQFKPEQVKQQKLDLEQVKANIQIGDRCRLIKQQHRGVVKYVGLVGGLNNEVWVGIQLDEPMGKNNGNVKGHQYFYCQDNYGIFMKPDLIEIGNFPEIDPFQSDDDEI